MCVWGGGGGGEGGKRGRCAVKLDAVRRGAAKAIKSQKKKKKKKKRPTYCIVFNTTHIFKNRDHDEV